RTSSANPGPSGARSGCSLSQARRRAKLCWWLRAGQVRPGWQSPLLRPRTVTVTLRFFHYLDESGQQIGTAWKPGDGQGIIDAMNSVVCPQANISFKLLKAEPMVVNKTFGPVIMDQVYDSTLKPQLDRDAEITVFFVGKWKHSEKNAPNASSWYYGK